MPDLIENGTDHIIWIDELCASCLNTGNCPLLAVLHEHHIQTHTGIHVFRCDNYGADTSSPHYLDPEIRDPTAIADRNLEALKQEADLLLKSMGGTTWP